MFIEPFAAVVLLQLPKEVQNFNHVLFLLEIKEGFTSQWVLLEVGVIGRNNHKSTS